MKIEWQDTQGVDSMGQFIVFAENVVERGLLRRFVNLAYKKGWKFWLHGSDHNCDLGGVTSFNFGCIKDKE